MSSFDPTIDATFREYAELELRCHFLLLDGKDNDPETLEAEDRMTVLWEKLDEVQRRSLNGMGSDLNWVRRKCEPPPKGRKLPEEVTEAEQQELVAAIGSKEWHRALHYLRLCAPCFSVAQLADMRGMLYRQVDLPVIASVFHEQAADLDPSNTDIGLSALSTTKNARPADAVRRAEKIIALPWRYPPAVLAYAAAIILQRDEIDGRLIDRQRFSALLNDAVRRSQLERSVEARTQTYELAAFGYELMGNIPAALRCLDEGLSVSPNHDSLLIDKAMFLYESQTDQAAEVFDRLTKAGTPSVFPYFFLAHFHLRKGKFGVSLELNREAWERADSDPLRAQLLEWQAICEAELHYPSAVVRPIFEQAISLDPSNLSIADNLAAFNDAVATAKKFVWQIMVVSQMKLQRAGTSRMLTAARKTSSPPLASLTTFTA